MSDFKTKMYQIQFCWGAYSALPDALAGLRGPTSKGRGGERKGRRGEGKGMEGMEMEGEGEAREGEGARPHSFMPP